MALPFNIGQICHVAGKLCEITDKSWESDQARDEGLAPKHVTVKFLESEPIDADRVLSLEGEDTEDKTPLHVPAVERFTGYLDGDESQVRAHNQSASRGKTHADQELTDYCVHVHL